MRVSTLIATLFCLAASPVLAAGNSCEDSELKEKLANELSLERIQKDCAASSKSKLALVEITGKDGKKVRMSCCEATRIQLHEAAENIFIKKKLFCGHGREQATKIDCKGSAECLEKNVALMDLAAKMNDRVADNASDARKIGEECERLMQASDARVKRELASVTRALARAKDKQKLLDRPSIGAKR